MEELIVMAVFILLYIIKAVLTKKPSNTKFIVSFLNSEGLRCSNGMILSGDILVRAKTLKGYSRENVEQYYLQIMREIMADKHPEWLYTNQDDCREEFLNKARSFENVKAYGWLNKNLEFADKKYYDPEKDAVGLEALKVIHDERDRQIVAEERKCEEEIARQNAEAAAKIKDLEEELARAEAAQIEEIRKINERAAAEVEAILKEEDAKRERM